MTHVAAQAHVEEGSFCIFRDVVKKGRSEARISLCLWVHLCNVIRPDTWRIRSVFIRCVARRTTSTFITYNLFVCNFALIRKRNKARYE